ncbi:hypothetical protein IEQ11_07770 [Lysobacter capsici]|uniref:hypothetical protein n=1 Tax=Lysobacter capsici TaxID=435897 RepID=UPI00177A7666|nr:hypothetical protein [Lysobacter capsici]UOF16535.1 hypothetical protein IEQ11_07770 [Lysobacter capsici]
MTAIHPFHRVVAATVRIGGAAAAVAPLPGALAPWLRYRCGSASAAPIAKRDVDGRRRDAASARSP